MNVLLFKFAARLVVVRHPPPSSLVFFQPYTEKNKTKGRGRGRKREGEREGES